MAKRPTVQEILAAARSAGPPPAESGSNPEASEAPSGKTGDAPDSPPAAPEPEGQAVGTTTPAGPAPNRPLTLQEKLAAARNRPAPSSTPPAGVGPESPPTDHEGSPAPPDPPTRDAAPPPGPTAPAPSGRPLTIQEKLAAARSRPPATRSAPTIATAEETVQAPQPPPASTRPLSLQEKLAAARSRPPGGPGQAPGAPAPASPAGSAPPTASVASARQLPSLDRMTDPRDLAEALRRAAHDRPAGPSATHAGAGGPARSALPATADVPSDADRTPRATSLRLPAAAGMIALVALGSLAVAVAWRVWGNSRGPATGPIAVGLAADFPPESVDATSRDRGGFWIVRSASYDGIDSIYALRAVCPDSGDDLAWEPAERVFRCPRDAARFARSGLSLGEVPPRSLERLGVSKAEDGRISIDPGMTFRRELGQWTDPRSFVAP